MKFVHYQLQRKRNRCQMGFCVRLANERTNKLQFNHVAIANSERNNRKYEKEKTKDENNNSTHTHARSHATHNLYRFVGIESLHFHCCVVTQLLCVTKRLEWIVSTHMSVMFSGWFQCARFIFFSHFSCEYCLSALSLSLRISVRHRRFLVVFIEKLGKS